MSESTESTTVAPDELVKKMTAEIDSLVKAQAALKANLEEKEAIVKSFEEQKKAVESKKIEDAKNHVLELNFKYRVYTEAQVKSMDPANVEVATRVLEYLDGKKDDFRTAGIPVRNSGFATQAGFAPLTIGKIEKKGLKA